MENEPAAQADNHIVVQCLYGACLPANNDYHGERLSQVLAVVTLAVGDVQAR